MFDLPVNILFDIGNTSTKYIFASSEVTCIPVSDIKRVANPELIALIATLPAGSKIYVSHVAETILVEQIVKLLKKRNLDYFIAKTQRNAFGVSNSYADVSKMGVDRWLAILGGRSLVESDYIVFDLGTAMTADVVVEGSHLGGWIAPGYNTLRSVLLDNTSKVFSNTEGQLGNHPFGKDTSACVELGIRSQIQGSFEFGLDRMNELSDQYHIFVTGGDNRLLNVSSFENVTIHENLVLQGLNLYI